MSWSRKKSQLMKSFECSEVFIYLDLSVATLHLNVSTVG